MTNSGLILTLAYPDSIVKISTEWYLSYLKFIGIGKNNYVRAGHAALVLIDKETGILEYYDFGRYITPKSYGRVRSLKTDNELSFPFKAILKNGEIQNLNTILTFLATHPQFTHGEGKLVASVCNAIDYKHAKHFINKLIQDQFIPYSVFKKNGSNCARFVTDTLIHGITDKRIKAQLKKSQTFTPSTVGNVIRANTEAHAFEVSENGHISPYKNSRTTQNLNCFFDRLDGFTPNLIGNIKPKPVAGIDKNAQWLSGTGSGAWFELHETATPNTFRFKRISPYGSVDVDAHFTTNNTNFNYNKPYIFLHASNCLFFNIKQNDTVFTFNRLY